MVCFASFESGYETIVLRKSTRRWKSNLHESTEESSAADPAVPIASEESDQ